MPKLAYRFRATLAGPSSERGAMVQVTRRFAQPEARGLSSCFRFSLFDLASSMAKDDGPSSANSRLTAARRAGNFPDVPTSLRVVFAPESISVDTVKTVTPRAELRLVGLGPPPSELSDGASQPCKLQFFVTYLNLVRSEEPSDPKLFATLDGSLSRSDGEFVFLAADVEEPIVHLPIEPAPDEEDPRKLKPLTYELGFDESQFNGLEAQILNVPRAVADRARFLELRASLELAGQPELALEEADAWDIPYARLPRRVTFSIFDSNVTGVGALLVNDGQGNPVFNGVGENGEASRDFDLTALPADDDYDIELSAGPQRLAPSLGINIKDLEFGLLLDDAKRAAGSVKIPDNALPATLTGSENHNFGDLPFEETPPGNRTFIDFQFVDQQGSPVPAANFVATFSDGTTQEGIADDSGKITLSGIPPGDVQIAMVDFTDDFVSVEDA
jgi:hypothetical protein